MPDALPPDEARLVSVIGAQLAAAGQPADLTDDCAALSVPTALVTTDTLIEGVHFDLRYDTPEQVGAQAAVQNLSDLAASGGAAGWLVWCLCLGPAQRTETFVAALARGFAETAARFDARIVGGNLSRTPGPLTVAVTAGGPLVGARALTRSGARAGETVYVTGGLGDAALGVDSPRYRADRHAWRPHLAEARLIARSGLATACIDISDGLLLDAARLALASEVTLALCSEAVPLAPACAALADASAARRHALTGGEDYVLLFTAPSAPPGLSCQVIGTVLDRRASGPLLLDDRPASAQGWDHFRGAESSSSARS